MQQKRGYRTKQKERILNALIENKNRHIGADELFLILKAAGEGAGKTTIYRALDEFVRAGVVRKYASEGSAACFQYIGEAGARDCEEHFHLKCVSCGELFHLSCDFLARMEEHVKTLHDFELDSAKTVLYGLCGGCRAQKRGTLL